MTLAFRVAALFLGLVIALALVLGPGHAKATMFSGGDGLVAQLAPGGSPGQAVRIRLPVRHVPLKIPTGSAQLAWLVALVLFALIDQISRRKRWSWDMVGLWRFGLGFISVAWRRMPAPLVLVVAGSLAMNAKVLISAPIGGVIENLAGLFMLIGSWLSFGAGYRLALQMPSLPVSRPWRLTLGAPELRLLGAFALALLLAFILGFALTLATDLIFRPNRGLSQGWLDRGLIHGLVIGVSTLVLVTALASLWPMAMIGGRWSIPSALAVTWGAWLPIGLSVMPPMLIDVGCHLLTTWTRAIALGGAGQDRTAAGVVALLAMPLTYAVLTPFSIGLSARRFQILAPLQAEQLDPLSVFD